jgi:hypothetical protein
MPTSDLGKDHPLLSQSAIRSGCIGSSEHAVPAASANGIALTAFSVKTLFVVRYRAPARRRILLSLRESQ